MRITYRKDLRSVGSMYTHSLYWALATTSSLGYGAGPVAVSEPELLFAILCQITGACLYAAIFGNIAHLISKADAPGARYQVRHDRHGALRVYALQVHAYAL